MTGLKTVMSANSTLPTDQEAITGAIEDLGNAIVDARIRIEGGETVNLAGLDDRVRTLCTAIGQLEGPAARIMLPRLVALTDGLDALESVLRRAHEKAAPLAEATAFPRRAANAYGATASRAE